MTASKAAIVFCATLLFFVASGAMARSNCDTALDQVYAVLKAYGKEHPSKVYPSTLKELREFAAKKSMRVSLRPFSEFTYKGFNRLYRISYTCRETGLGGTMSGGDTIKIY